jgi:four helix bundle protein
MKSHRDLEIFHEAKRLAIEVHKITLILPKFELYEEGSQIRRSSKAIASSIAEGYGRKKYKADFIKYLIYSHAECDETIVHLEFLFETESFKDKEKFEHLADRYDSLGRRINKYIQWVEEHWNETV